MQEFHTPAEFDIAPGETCLTALLDTARRYPHGVMSPVQPNFEWVNVTSAEFVAECSAVAKGLVASGVQPR